MTGTAPPLDRVTLGAFPYYPDNPWQRVIYRSLSAAGADIAELAAPDFGRWALEVRETGRVPVLHMNWTGPISQAAPDIQASSDQVDRALDELDAAIAADVRVLWTVHNVLPHDAAYLLPELRLCRGLAERADAVLVMNDRTPEAVRPWYELPDHLVRRVSLPSYVGEYPNTVDRTEARARFGLPHDSPTLLMAGVLRPYKGLEELIAAVPGLRSAVPGVRILIAGEAAGYSQESLRVLLDGAPEVQLEGRFIPDDQLQWWFKAADALVLPYRAGLNSGAMLLGATFGLPVIMTESDAAAEVASERWVHVIGRSEPLADGIGRGLAGFRDDQQVRDAALAYAEARAPGIAAAEFTREVERVLARPRRSSR